MGSRQKERKEGKGRKRNIEKDRDRKDIGRDKGQWRSIYGSIRSRVYFCSFCFLLILLCI